MGYATVPLRAVPGPMLDDITGPVASPSWIWMTTAGFLVNATAEAPSIPGVSAPPDGSEVSVRRPTLEVVNAADADGDTLTYSFQVYADAGLTTLVDSRTDLAEGSGATTAWRISADDAARRRLRCPS